MFSIKKRLTETTFGLGPQDQVATVDKKQTNHDSMFWVDQFSNWCASLLMATLLNKTKF